MAISGIGSGSSGQRRSLDAEINLVPFIDLLSMCICFLLMTAVWTQLGAVQVKQAVGTDAAVQTKSIDLEVKMLSGTEVQYGVKGSKFEKSSIEQFEHALASYIAQLAKQNRSIGAVMVTPNAKADYGNLVSVMDFLRKNSLQNIGVVPVRGEL